MSNVTIFTNPEFGQLRTIEREGELWFVAKDVAAILGYRQFDNMYKLLEDSDYDTINPQLTEFTGFLQNGGSLLEPNKNIQTLKIINESGLYACIFNSTLPAAKLFKKWVTAEVLPTIRKTGGYVQENRAVDFVNAWMPDLSEASKNVLAEIIDSNRKLLIDNKKKDERIEEMKPAEDFFHAVADSSGAIDIGEMAKLLNITDLGRNKLFKILRQLKIFNDRNQPYQQYVDSGYFKLIEQTFDTPAGDNRISLKTVVLGKGQVYVRKRVLAYLQHNINFQQSQEEDL